MSMNRSIAARMASEIVEYVPPFTSWWRAFTLSGGNRIATRSDSDGMDRPRVLAIAVWHSYDQRVISTYVQPGFPRRAAAVVGKGQVGRKPVERRPTAPT